MQVIVLLNLSAVIAALLYLGLSRASALSDEESHPFTADVAGLCKDVQLSERTSWNSAKTFNQ